MIRAQMASYNESTLNGIEFKLNVQQVKGQYYKVDRRCLTNVLTISLNVH
jgi:hypothetical protein